MKPRFESPSNPPADAPFEGFPAGRLFTVRETAKILGLCLDSVRHHLRSGQLPGVRVGRSWRVPERVLLAQLGLATMALGAPVVEMETDPKKRSTLRQVVGVFPAPSITSDADTASSQAVSISGLETKAMRERTRNLVVQAAHHADLSQRATQRLLAELDDLLGVEH